MWDGEEIAYLQVSIFPSGAEGKLGMYTERGPLRRVAQSGVHWPEGHEVRGVMVPGHVWVRVVICSFAGVKCVGTETLEVSVHLSTIA